MRHALLFCCVLFAACKKTELPASIVGAPTAYFPPLTGSDWTTTTPESLGWRVASIQPLYDYLASTNTKAFIVLKDGKIVLERYFGQNLVGTGAFNRDSQWYWASAGKTLTGFMIGKAQEDRFLTLDQPTSRYLGGGWTSLPAAKENLITIRHQLTMTTGLDDGVANSGNTSPANLVYKADAGSRWAYHNAPYTLLERVVSQATKQPFDAYFAAKLTQKTGMDGQWRWSGDDHVFWSTPRSMARFGLLMANKGRWDGQPILADTAFIHASLTTSQDLNKSYGYLWWLNGKASAMVPGTQTVFTSPLAAAAPTDMVAAMGKNGQILSIVPSSNIIMVRMGDTSDNVPVPVTYQNEIWKRLSAVIN